MAGGFEEEGARGLFRSQRACGWTGRNWMVYTWLYAHLLRLMLQRSTANMVGAPCLAICWPGAVPPLGLNPFWVIRLAR